MMPKWDIEKLVQSIHVQVDPTMKPGGFKLVKHTAKVDPKTKDLLGKLLADQIKKENAEVEKQLAAAFLADDIVLDDIVTAQPMTAPISKIFSMRFRYPYAGQLEFDFVHQELREVGII